MKVDDLERGQINAETNSTTQKNTKNQTWSTCQVKKSLIMLFNISIILMLVAAVWYYMGWKFLIQLALVAVVAFIATGQRYRWFYIALFTLKRDLTAFVRFARLVGMNWNYSRKNLSVTDIFIKNAQKYPDKPAIVFENSEWTFKDVENYSNKIANLFLKEGFRRGDKVALLLENRPEFVCIWLGLAKLGIIVPLINYNIRDQSLVHSITVADAQAIILGEELLDAVKSISSSLPSSMSFYVWTDKKKENNNSLIFKDLNSLLAEASSEPSKISEKLNYTDRLLYIYTSGTTGLPKAAVITGARWVKFPPKAKLTLHYN